MIRKLISLERRRTNLRVYHIASLCIALCLLGMLYLFAAIPHFDPTEAEEALFLTYTGLITMNNLLAMAAFSILFAVMGARLIVEAYSGKQAILLLSYPVSRSAVLTAKLVLIGGYTFRAMLLCGGGALLIFLLSESLFPLCPEPLQWHIFFEGAVSLLLHSCIAIGVGMVSVWLGLLRRSLIVSVVASVLLASVVCQAAAAAFTFAPVLPILSGAAALLAAAAALAMLRRIDHMEVLA